MTTEAEVIRHKVVLDPGYEVLGSCVSLSYALAITHRGRELLGPPSSLYLELLLN